MKCKICIVKREKCLDWSAVSEKRNALFIWTPQQRSKWSQPLILTFQEQTWSHACLSRNGQTLPLKGFSTPPYDSPDKRQKSYQYWAAGPTSCVPSVGRTVSLFCLPRLKLTVVLLNAHIHMDSPLLCFARTSPSQIKLKCVIGKGRMEVPNTNMVYSNTL